MCGRTASGDPSLWTGLALAIRAALTAQLHEASFASTELLEILEKPDEEAHSRFLAEAKNLRDTVPAICI
jgi:prephenate dehydrogenase